jgi:mRNA interferase RelE/StbE
MIYEFEKSFVRDFRKLKSKALANAILECIDQVSNASAINNINNLKKLTGYKNAYRIRIGDYRLGIVLQDEKVIFVAFAHRNEIYKKFPL